MYYKFNLICGIYQDFQNSFKVSILFLAWNRSYLVWNIIIYVCAKYKMKAPKNLFSFGTNHNERPRKLSQSVLPALGIYEKFDYFSCLL